jgi:enoyl-CoA hydratase
MLAGMGNSGPRFQPKGGYMPNNPPTVRTEKKGPVTTVILSRPEVRNAVDHATAGVLADAFQTFEADKEAKVAVFFGEQGTFCAGADLKAIASGDLQGHTKNVFEGDGPMGPTRMVLCKPVIAAVAGHAVAGGLELALWCDLRVMEEDAILGVFSRRWGVPLIDGGTVRLPRLIGLGHALDLIITGRPVTAQEALSMGLVNRVVPKGKAREAAEKLALEISSFPQACLNTDRMSAYTQWDLPLKEALRNEFKKGFPMVEAEGRSGAARFVGGAGRRGKLEN